MTLLPLRVRFPVTAAALGTHKLFGFKRKKEKKKENRQTKKEKERQSKRKSGKLEFVWKQVSVFLYVRHFKFRQNKRY